jgi:hypothetical protein
VTVSPLVACPQLETIDCSFSGRLEEVLIQSNSVTTINLADCASLRKLLLHCSKLVGSCRARILRLCGAGRCMAHTQAVRGAALMAWLLVRVCRPAWTCRTALTWRACPSGAAP